MASMVQQQWKERALVRSETITDAWEVTKAYAGRIAEWVLFLCMIANIIEMLPSVSLPTTVSNTVLGIQVVMLDVGGFSLSTMAQHARERGESAVAKKAQRTAYLLIAVMMITLLLVTVGLLFPELQYYTGIGEKLLILGRVVLTVWYGHVVHSLRGTTVKTISVQEHEDKISEIMTAFNQQIITVQNTVNDYVKQAAKLQEDNALLSAQLTDLSALIEAQKESQKDVDTEPEIEVISSEENMQENDDHKSSSEPSTSRRTMTIEEVIQATGLTERQVKNLIKKRELKPSSRNANLVLVSSFQDWQNKR